MGTLMFGHFGGGDTRNHQTSVSDGETSAKITNFIKY
jgi:hypothetical protein